MNHDYVDVFFVSLILYFENRRWLTWIFDYIYKYITYYETNPLSAPVTSNLSIFTIRPIRLRSWVQVF